MEKSGRQHRKNGLGVDALTGIFLQTYPDAPVSQATVSSAAKGSVPVEAASASFSRKKVEHDLTVVLSGTIQEGRLFILHFRRKTYDRDE